jgi:hypothetical protein
MKKQRKSTLRRIITVLTTIATFWSPVQDLFFYLQQRHSREPVYIVQIFVIDASADDPLISADP